MFNSLLRHCVVSNDAVLMVHKTLCVAYSFSYVFHRAIICLALSVFIYLLHHFIQDSGQPIPLVVESCIRYINLYGESHIMLL